MAYKKAYADMRNINHQGTNKKGKGINLKQSGILLILVSLFFWSFLVFYKATTIQDLQLIQGEFNGSRKAQVVKKSKVGSNKSTVISLKNYPNIEFNLGENFIYDRLSKELKLASPPIMIKLNIEKRFFKKDREIVPAFYGFWINDKQIESDEDGFKTNRQNRRIFMVAGLLFSGWGIWLVIAARRKVKIESTKHRTSQ